MLFDGAHRAGRQAEADAAAKAQLEAWFPGRDVYVVEMLDSWMAGGGVHCHT